jgi:hypothetical protein
MPQKNPKGLSVRIPSPSLPAIQLVSSSGFRGLTEQGEAIAEKIARTTEVLKKIPATVGELYRVEKEQRPNEEFPDDKMAKGVLRRLFFPKGEDTPVSAVADLVDHSQQILLGFIKSSKSFDTERAPLVKITSTLISGYRSYSLESAPGSSPLPPLHLGPTIPKAASARVVDTSLNPSEELDRLKLFRR